MSRLGTLAGALLLGAVAATPASAAMDIYGFVADYNWREYGSGLHVDENGPIYGLGIAGSYVAPSPSLLSLRGKIEAFGGELDNDSLFVDEDDVTNIFTNRSAIAGFTTEGTIGMHARLGGGLSLEPLAGFGYRYWMRDFEFVDIEEERWQNVYGKVGVRLEQKVAGTPITAFVEGGARISIKTWTTYDLGIGDVTVYPKNRTTSYVEGGVRLSQLRFTMFYENLHFGASDTASFTDGIDIFEAQQPKSEADIIGLRIGAVF